MTDPFSDLTCVDVATLQAVFPSPADDHRNAHVGIDGERKHARRTTKRQYLNQLAVSNAADALSRLPDQGESFHGIMAGNFHAFAFLPAIIRLAGCPAAEVWIATLGFNKSNTLELFDLLDKGDVQKCGFLFSTYFRSNEPETTDALISGLQARGQRVAVVRNHAKIILARMIDSRSFAWESSANMRSCRNVESYVLTNDADLLEFHAAWIHQLLTKGNQK